MYCANQLTYLNRKHSKARTRGCVVKTGNKRTENSLSWPSDAFRHSDKVLYSSCRSRLIWGISGGGFLPVSAAFVSRLPISVQILRDDRVDCAAGDGQTATCGHGDGRLRAGFSAGSSGPWMTAASSWRSGSASTVSRRTGSSTAGGARFGHNAVLRAFVAVACGCATWLHVVAQLGCMWLRNLVARPAVPDSGTMQYYGHLWRLHVVAQPGCMWLRNLVACGQDSRRRCPGERDPARPASVASIVLPAVEDLSRGNGPPSCRRWSDGHVRPRRRPSEGGMLGGILRTSTNPRNGGVLVFPLAAFLGLRYPFFLPLLVVIIAIDYALVIPVGCVIAS